MKYIKKQIPVEAVIFEGFENVNSRLPELNLLSDCATVCFSEIPTWLAAELGEKVKLFSERPNHLSIETLEGRMYIKPGDYIIRGVKGELYGCDAEIFKETYEKVEG